MSTTKAFDPREEEDTTPDTPEEETQQLDEQGTTAVEPDNEPEEDPEESAARRREAELERKRKTIRRRRQLASVAAALIVVFAIAAIAPFTPALPVKKVVVNGANTLADEEIIAASGISEGTPIGRVDMKAAASGVAANDWVKSASLKRDWPSTIEITVRENIAVAYIGEGDQARLINGEGKEFTVATPPPGAIKIDGPAIQDEAVLAAGVEVATSISERMRGQVLAVVATGPYEFELTLADGRKVTWGAAEDNANKAIALEDIVQREGGEFNLSNPELVTVK
ncbi:cell division protein FtsQ/DivIB [Corynebacterium mayonis]|uniref:cell division protein FtsQ/DivIB n=1 Tax=Corynebacterium mayonis TaxID=3062461 RepID=UPI003140591B